MFIVCEPISWDLEHVPFNAAFLKTIRLSYPHEVICFYGEESHSDHLKRQIGVEVASSIQWEKIKLPRRHTSFFSRIPADFKLVKYLLNQLNYDNKYRVLVITGNPSLLWALKYNVCSLHKDKKIQVVVHGDFSKLRYRGSLRQSINPLYHISSLKTALRMYGYQHIKHIVLEEVIREAIIEEMPFLRNNICVLDHPIPCDDQHLVVNDFKPPIQIGYLGRVCEQKGFSKYLSVVSDISMKFPGLVNFHAIGWTQANYEHSGYDLLTTKPMKERLSRREYIEHIRKLHFVCMFYEKYYEFTASGVLMDSIAWEKPIITTKLPLFENLQTRFGDIGYVCENGKLSESISSLLENMSTEKYERQVLNLRQIKKSRTPASLSKKYRDIVESELSI